MFAWPDLLRAHEGIYLAGAEIAHHNTYAYVGMVRSASGQLGYGFLQRLWLDLCTYSYDKNGERIDAQFGRVSGALGYQQSSERGWWTVYLGAAYRYTDLSPSDPASAANGHQFNPLFLLEGERKLALSWRANGAVSYVAGQEAYWARGRLLRALTEKRSAGIELVLHGDPDYRVTQAGVLIDGITLDGRVNLAFKLGLRKEDQESTSAYFGVEFSSSF